MKLIPEQGEGYLCEAAWETYPYQAVIEELDGGQKYYFVIRARDGSSNKNEEKNTVFLEEIPLQ